MCQLKLHVKNAVPTTIIFLMIYKPLLKMNEKCLVIFHQLSSCKSHSNFDPVFSFHFSLFKTFLLLIQSTCSSLYYKLANYQFSHTKYWYIVRHWISHTFELFSYFHSSSSDQPQLLNLWNSINGTVKMWDR